MATLRNLFFGTPRPADGPVAAVRTPSELAQAAGQAADRWAAFNRRRLQGLERQIGEKASEALRLLPFLLHVNQPGVPGYEEDLAGATGIAGYAPSNGDVSLARRVFRNDQVRRTGVLCPTLDLVAVMGSAGTIGFTGDSDLDVWVCHNDAAPTGSGLKAYQRKVEEIERWLNEQSGLEVHLFLQSTTSIRSNNFGEATVEGCGSAMGALLKEEFYRTAVYLAGKLPYWCLVAPDAGPDEYACTLRALQTDPDFTPDAHVDLGWVARVPLGELFGAAIWQIVKGWKAPFKSALKMGLLEQAVIGGGDATPLCELVKARVLRGECPDPYRVLFDEVLEYYRNRSDTSTEDLLARCFYLKTGTRLDPEHLDRPPGDGSDVAVLCEYVAAWGWGARRVRHLNQFDRWRFEWVRALAEEVDRFFLRTYKRIRTALDECGEAQRITPRDLTILGRKLQTVYRKAPHKVETVHLIKHSSVEEATLSLYQEVLPDGESPWRLYRGRVTPLNVEEMESNLLYESADLVELVVWAAQNKLLGERTRLQCKGVAREISAADLEALAQILFRFCVACQQEETPLEQLLEAPRPVRMLVVPNLGLEHAWLREIGALYSTTWGEVFYRRWAGAGCFRQFAEGAFLSFVAESASPRDVQVFLPPRKVGGLHGPQRRLQRELPELATFLGEAQDAGVRRRQVGADEGGFFVLEKLGETAGQYRPFAAMDEVLRYLSGVGPYRRVETRVEGHTAELALLKTLFANATPGVIDVFLLEEADRETLYVVDEVGNFSHFSNRAEREPYALAKLLLFLEGVVPELAAQPHSPLRAPILSEVVRIHALIYEGTCRIQTATHEYLGKTQALGLDPVGLTIEKVEAEDPAGGGGYRITWGDQTLRSGEVPNPLEEVRRRIHATRASRLSYGVFVTRLFLDDRFQREYCGDFTSTGHYLFYKKAIEQRLSGPA